MSVTFAPSPFQIEQAMSAALTLRQTLLTDHPELAEDDSGLLADVLDGETDALELARRLIRFSIEARSMADAADQRITSLTLRRDRFKRAVALSRSTALQMLDALGQRKLTEPDFTATIQAGRSSVVVTDEAALPDEMVRIKREPDKAAIKAALDSGREVEGAVLSNGTATLAVRTK